MGVAHSDYVAKLVSWAEQASAVRAIIVLGSIAQPGAEDELSDIDLMLITTKPRWLRAGHWLDEISPAPVFSWTYRSPIGRQTIRQVVYDGPLVVDVSMTSRTQAIMSGSAASAFKRLPALRRAFPLIAEQLDAWSGITRRGTRIVLDKDGVAARMTQTANDRLLIAPAETEFLNCVRSLLGLVLWQSKQLVRGELWMALATVDPQVKQQLLCMLQWHAVAHSGTRDTSYGGRHITQWVDQQWSSSLRKVWSHFEVEDAWSGLTATLDLFCAVAKEVATELSFPYPTEEEQQVRTWLSERLPR